MSRWKKKSKSKESICFFLTEPKLREQVYLLTFSKLDGSNRRPLQSRKIGRVPHPSSCIKNNALYKIQSASWGAPFKISFISAARVTLPCKGRQLCFGAQRRNSPWIDLRRALTQYVGGRMCTAKREQGMEVEIMCRPTEAWNTNERCRMGLWFRGLWHRLGTLLCHPASGPNKLNRLKLNSYMMLFFSYLKKKQNDAWCAVVKDWCIR